MIKQADGAHRHRSYSLTEPTMLVPGPEGFSLINPDITTNGHALTVEVGGVLRAPTIDGSRDPADWGAHVEIKCPVHTEFRLYGPLEWVVDLKRVAKRRGGIDGLSAYYLFLDIIKASGNEAMTAAEFKAAYAAQAGELITYSDALYNLVKDNTPTGSTFAGVRDLFRGLTMDQAVGLKTEVVESYG